MVIYFLKCIFSSCVDHFKPLKRFFRKMRMYFLLGANFGRLPGSALICKVELFKSYTLVHFDFRQLNFMEFYYLSVHNQRRI